MQCFLADALFGNCQRSAGPKDHFQYYLDRENLSALEDEIIRLLRARYTWHDIYTQCVLGNMLLAYRKGVSFDPYWCDRGDLASNDVSNALTADTTGMLQQYFQNYYDQMTTEPDSFSRPSKKDEFVTVHKYYSQEKRDEEEDEAAINLDHILAQLQPEDLDAIQNYLEDIEDPVVTSDDSDLPLVDYPDLQLGE